MSVASLRKSSRLKTLDSGFRRSDVAVISYAIALGLFKVVEIKHPLVLILSKDGRRWFDKLTMSGGRRTLKRP